jgi:hypothetical protein
MTKTCSFPDCHAKALAKGLCAKHYMRLRRRGDPAKVGRRGRPVNALGQAQRATMRQAMVSDRTIARLAGREPPARGRRAVSAQN